MQLVLKYEKDEKSFSLVEESKGNKKSEIKDKKVYKEDNEENDNEKEKEKEQEKDDTSKLNDEEEKKSY